MSEQRWSERLEQLAHDADQDIDPRGSIALVHWAALKVWADELQAAGFRVVPRTRPEIELQPEPQDNPGDRTEAQLRVRISNQDCMLSNLRARISELEAQLTERERHNETLDEELQQADDAIRECGVEPGAKTPADFIRYLREQLRLWEATLRQIAAWDALNPPPNDGSDLPWLKRLVDEALASIHDPVAPEPAEQPEPTTLTADSVDAADARERSAQEAVDAARPRFIQEVLYYAGMMLDEDWPSHSLGHIEQAVKEFRSLLEQQARVASGEEAATAELAAQAQVEPGRAQAIGKISDSLPTSADDERVVDELMAKRAERLESEQPAKRPFNEDTDCPTCGKQLSEADIEAGEAFCLKCRATGRSGAYLLGCQAAEGEHVAECFSRETEMAAALGVQLDSEGSDNWEQLLQDAAEQRKRISELEARLGAAEKARDEARYDASCGESMCNEQHEALRVIAERLGIELHDTRGYGVHEEKRDEFVDKIQALKSAAPVPDVERALRFLQHGIALGEHALLTTLRGDISEAIKALAGEPAAPSQKEGS